MLTKELAEDILRTLRRLPPEKVLEVQDFIGFLTERYARTPAGDESNAWSEEDMRELTAAVLGYADQTVSPTAEAP